MSPSWSIRGLHVSPAVLGGHFAFDFQARRLSRGGLSVYCYEIG